jgi:hypothetical protein
LNADAVNPTAAHERLVGAGDAILAAVDRLLPHWVETQVARIADAWGRLDDAARVELALRAHDAGERASRRIVAALRELFDTDVRAQRATPLEIVRTAAREVTDVLAGAGIPPVERDAFHERAFPDDHYGVTLATLADLGDPDLGPLHLAWGLAKAATLRAG